MARNKGQFNMFSSKDQPGPSWSYNYQAMQSVPITTKVVIRIPLGQGVLDTKLCDKVCQ